MDPLIPNAILKPWMLALAWSAFSAVTIAGEEPVDFARDIAPILAQHCVQCHAPGIEKGEISLATIEDLSDNEYLIAGDPDNTYLLELVTASDGKSPVMPKDGAPLSEEEIHSLRRWITQGAEWPVDVVVREKPKADASWWSLQPLKSTKKQALDDFIRAKLGEHNLSLNPPADRRTLIRRATYDLTGLPPTPDEVEAFVNDSDANAYEKLIERLLDSPHYGERWGRHWLDVVRFGESIGYERNVIINNLWPFRDYVIRSINADKPFNQLIREHIAGDVFGKDNPDVAVGSAFLVAGPYDDVGNQDPLQAAQIRANTLDEIIRATGEAFLGMTLGCARCHDHKFDPITQQDYYGLYATFSGIRHGSVELATPAARAERAAKLKPLNERKAALEQAQRDRRATVLKRARERLAEYEAAWTRPPVDRKGTEERFEPVTAKYVRLVCESQDINPNSATGFGIDEFEVWSSGPERQNVALACHGGKATGSARQIEDFPHAYGPQHAIDGKTGARFIAIGTDLTIELAGPTLIDRVVLSSAMGEQTPNQREFVFVAEYRIEVSENGKTWRQVASGHDRQPVNRGGHLKRRLLQLETTAEERAEQSRVAQELATVTQQIAQVPTLASVWIGQRVARDAQGPFHVFLGGNPQNKGEEVVAASLSVLRRSSAQVAGTMGVPQPITSGPRNAPATSSTASQSGHRDYAYKLPADAPESERRQALADWIVHPDNPLTPRVLANRLWHYHFGTGIVDTPSDFGYMGGKPTHPELLDFLALRLKENGWRLKGLHRLIMTSQTYQQSSAFRDDAARVDGDSRWRWRFSPRRLSAEEVRDTILAVSGKLGTTRGGPGFRLYRFLQDNVCTYVPLDQHGPETYRRAVYHQNARASVVDLMTEFDQPDCTFSAPQRDQTTTPLQALTMLNHGFTLNMASALAECLQGESGDDHGAQIRRAYQLCYSRLPAEDEASACQEFIQGHGLVALCRVLLNTSEMIYVQ